MSLLRFISYSIYFFVFYSDFEACSDWELSEILSHYQAVTLVLLNFGYIGYMACIEVVVNIAYLSVMYLANWFGF